MRGDSGVAGEWRVVGIPKLHSWGKCTMPLTNINSDWISNASSTCVLHWINYACPLSCIWGVINIHMYDFDYLAFYVLHVMVM